jgi:hypothetical protein
MARETEESPEIRILRAEHAATDKALGLLIATKKIGSPEYLEAEKARSAAWDKLREALGWSCHFRR